MKSTFPHPDQNNPWISLKYVYSFTYYCLQCCHMPQVIMGRGEGLVQVHKRLAGKCVNVYRRMRSRYTYLTRWSRLYHKVGGRPGSGLRLYWGVVSGGNRSTMSNQRGRSFSTPQLSSCCTLRGQQSPDVCGQIPRVLRQFQSFVFILVAQTPLYCSQSYLFLRLIFGFHSHNTTIRQYCYIKIAQI